MVANLSMRLTSVLAAVLAVGIVLSMTVRSARGQVQESRTKQGVDLIVDGDVENIYQSDKEYLVQIRVHRSAVPQLDVNSSARYPAPGEHIYAHAGSDQSIGARAARRSRTGMLPKRQTRIRAYLHLGPGNQWEATGPDWFAESAGLDDDLAGNPRRRATGTRSIGITSELAFYGGEAAVKVTKVDPSSPAQRAGIVPGLLILEANGKPVTSPDQLRTAERGARRDLELQVVDPREKRKRLVRVTL